MKPIELRLNKHRANGVTFYTVDKVWEGIGNVTFGQARFMTANDARRWCRTEYNGVPLLTNY